MTEPIFDGEVLDLRELILVLWRRKWLIIGITGFVGLVVFIITAYILPDRYQSSAIITITDRTTMAALELNSLPNIAQAPDLQKETLDILGITDLEKAELVEFTADADVRSQLILSVTAADPDLAAETANTWAEVVSQKINALYGTSDDSLARLEEEILLADEIWTEANLELESFRSESGLNIYPAQLAAGQFALEENLREIERNRLLISDVQSLEAQIENMDPTNFLPVGFKLSLINLQARLTAVQEVNPLQMLAEEPILSQQDVVVYLHDLKTILESQNQQLDELVNSLKIEITELSQFLEEDLSREAQLLEVRDQTHYSYKRLLSSLEDKKVLQIQEESYIVISSEALRPQAPVNSSILTSVTLASVSAGLLSILGILFQTWWLKKDQVQA